MERNRCRTPLYSAEVLPAHRRDRKDLRKGTGKQRRDMHHARKVKALTALEQDGEDGSGSQSADCYFQRSRGDRE